MMDKPAGWPKMERLQDMGAHGLIPYLKFYFITEEGVPGFPPLKQVETAIAAGATVVQYRNKSFSSADIDEVFAIRKCCATHRIPLLINDNVLLALAVGADGVHLGQTDEEAPVARRILGAHAIIGISVSTPEELSKTDLSPCDYVGTGPVFPTGTKPDASPVIGLSGLKTIAQRSPLPIVAIGGVNAENISSCLSSGAVGGAVISCITRSGDPQQAALDFAAACGCPPRELDTPWHDEFALIDRLVESCSTATSDPRVRVGAGDDAALFFDLKQPVFTTDAQRENVHFRRDWLSPVEIGQKAVEITLSDLAAVYARPVALFVNLTLPAAMPESDIAAIYTGIGNRLTAHGAFLGGGNISAGECLALDLFAVGEGRDDIFPLRSAARPGDGLYVTGPLGLARAGLSCLTMKDTDFPELVLRFTSPSARFDAADVLAENGVKCAMDISDGLAGDAAHIAIASGVTIEFDRAHLPVSPHLKAYCEKYRRNPAIEILSGGEDYELLFACPPEVFERIRRILPDAAPVGRCLPYAGSPLLNLPGGAASFEHAKK